MTARFGQLLGVSGGGGSDSSLVANNDTYSTPEDTPLVVNVLSNDTTSEGSLSVLWFLVQVNGDDPSATQFDAGSTAQISGVGTLRITQAGSLTFTPNPDYSGSVPTVRYLVTNGHGVRIGTVSITVTPANDAPVANDDARITLVDTPITFNVLDTDSDPDGDPITVTLINGSPFVNGNPIDLGDAVLVANSNGTVTVTPDTSFVGQIQFTYTISDGSLTDTATVTVLVGASNESMFSAANPISGPLGLAAFNFGLTFRGLYGQAYNNGVNVTVPPYSANQGLFSLLNREPWLYDRASTMYTLYLRTQNPQILAEAVSLADTYMASVDVTGNGLGRFTVVGGAAGADITDIKYLYSIIGVWYERETGSSVHRAKSLAMYNQSLVSFSKTYNPVSAALWTERNVGYAIQNCVSAYWLHRYAGNITAANTALQDAWDYFTMVEGMSASGAPLHGHNQHEGSAITTPISSPWMSAFLAEALVQLYRTDPDNRILTWLSNYGNWIIANAVYVTDGSELGTLAGLRLPAYLAANTATPLTYREGELLDMEHAADVAGLMEKVVWAKTVLGLSTSAASTLQAELETAAGHVFDYWTRTTEGYPRYRVNPPRKYGWWFRNRYSSAALIFTAQVPTLPLSLTSVSISGSTQQGQTLTATPGTWDGFPTPSLTYQWYRDGSPIGGATGSTYVTQVADISTAITCRETATNTAGANYITSNTINVVAAGAPEITVHPSNVTGEVGQTVQFSATCTASPTATFQWQRNTGSGWANVSGGSGGSGTGNSTTYTSPTLDSGFAGNQYRCAFTNAGGTTYTNAATLSLLVDQGSISLSGNTNHAALTFDIGDVGHANLVIEALVYFTARTSSANFLGLRHTGNGRSVFISCNNTFEVYAIGVGDSQTGHTAFADQPPLNTWLHVTIQCQTVAGGDQIRATWTVAEGAEGTRYAVTRTNGVEDSVQGQQTFIGGLIGQASQGATRYQYVRARTGYLADNVVDGHRQDTDATGGGWAFWWRFFDAGGGVPGVEDKTGNNRVPTITGGVYAAGPVVPGVP